MKIHTDSGQSFKVWSNLTVVFEILSSGAVIALAAWAYLLKVGTEFRLTYAPSSLYPSVNYKVVNHTYEVLVTSWILLVLTSLSIARFVAATILAIGIKKNSTALLQFWIAFKVLGLMISVFLTIASFNVSLIVKVTALAALTTDLVSSYFIRVLYPELEKMRKFIKMDVTVDSPPTNKL